MEDKYALNLDAPDTDGEEEIADDMLLPAPDMVLPDYLDPHAAEIEQLTAFVRYLFPSYAIAGICGTDDSSKAGYRDWITPKGRSAVNRRRANALKGA